MYGCCSSMSSCSSTWWYVMWCDVALVWHQFPASMVPEILFVYNLHFTFSYLDLITSSLQMMKRQLCYSYVFVTSNWSCAWSFLIWSIDYDAKIYVHHKQITTHKHTLVYTLNWEKQKFQFNSLHLVSLDAEDSRL